MMGDTFSVIRRAVCGGRSGDKPEDEEDEDGKEFQTTGSDVMEASDADDISARYRPIKDAASTCLTSDSLQKDVRGGVWAKGSNLRQKMFKQRGEGKGGRNHPPTEAEVAIKSRFPRHLHKVR